MVSPSRILLISGSLRRNSTNTASLRTAQVVAPVGVDAILYEGLGSLPHFNPDDDRAPLAPAVETLRATIHWADASLFSTPEYAGALPGSFKNLLDWTIGDDQPGSINEKPVAWINASPRAAVHAHDSLRLVLGFANAVVVEPACIHVPVTAAAIDAQGTIPNHDTRDHIARAIEALSEYVAAPRVSR